MSEATARMSNPISRRGFVAAGALAAAAVDTISAQSFAVLSPDQARLAAALADAIIPPDPEWPGAAEAGAVSYLDQQLQGALQRFAPLYRMGLPALDATALRMTSKSFLDLSVEERTALLKRVEAGEAEGPEWPDFSAKVFFQKAIEHTMQSYYGSPEHGGNEDGVSWEMLGVTAVMH